MSDLGTAIATIQGDLKGLLDASTVRRKVVDSIRFHKQNKLWFSERTFSFVLTVGRAEYGIGDGFGLPEDLVEITSKPMWMLLNGSETNQARVFRAGTNEFDLYRASGTSSGDPEYWDFQSKRLRVWPTPAIAHTLRGNYMRDNGTPYYAYDAGSFTFKAPDGSPLLDTFTNDWLDPQGAFHLICARALWLCFKNLRDDVAANDAMGSWLEMKAQIEDESAARVDGPMQIVGCILD